VVHGSRGTNVSKEQLAASGDCDFYEDSTEEESDVDSSDDEDNSIVGLTSPAMPRAG